LLEQAFSTPALVFLLLGVCATAASGWRSRRPLRQGEFFAHILMDWLWLPPLLAVSGGAANPFITYFLVPLTIAAATLSRLYSWLMAALCIATYTWLMLVFPGAATSDPHSTHAFQRHLLGMWATFAFSALLIAGFVNGMAATLRQRDRHLHRLRQEQARRDQILSLATLAAGTAHELATPLQTMGLLVEELQDQPGLRESADLQLLRQQIDACNQALAQLKARARDPDKRSAEPVAQFLARCLERWQLLRPEARFTLQQRGPADTFAILPLTLEQVLTNLLNNSADANARAADACAQTISVRAEWDTQSLRVYICDSGSGVDETQDSSQRGFGIGLLLSEAALTQLGGNLSLKARGDGSAGTEASFRIPLIQPEIRATPIAEMAL
jgi:two-component system sensor histidine kinase RegB